MADLSGIRSQMDVIGSDGVKVGIVDHLDGDRIKLAKAGSTDGEHHYVAGSDVARVDAHVHLTRPAAAILGATRGISGVLPPIANPTVDGATPRANYLPWILLATAFLVGLLLLSFCHRDQPGATGPTSVDTAGAVLPVEAVKLPNGQSVDLAPQTLNYELQRYLASTEASPRTFVFDKLNFSTNSAAIRDEDRPTVDALAMILGAYPKAMVEIAGYTDARGTAPANANLGQQRATAVVGALVAKGVDAARIQGVSGGESNPTDTNATPGGRFENRRTELTVTAK